MSDVLKKLTREMEKVQEPKRFVHTQGVEYTAAALAMINCCQPARNTTFR